jgi:prevent-host-death family protein
MVESGEKWSIAAAKARFSEVVDRAIDEGPQQVTRGGRPAVVIVSAEEWTRKTSRKGSLAEFLSVSPLRGSRLKVDRAQTGARKVEL